jgi:hypothetical protein
LNTERTIQIDSPPSSLVPRLETLEIYRSKLNTARELQRRRESDKGAAGFVKKYADLKMTINDTQETRSVDTSIIIDQLPSYNIKTRDSIFTKFTGVQLRSPRGEQQQVSEKRNGTARTGLRSLRLSNIRDIVEQRNPALGDTLEASLTTHKACIDSFY